LKLDTNSKLTIQVYDKRNDFIFSIVNFPYLHICNNIPSSPAYDVYILQLILVDIRQSIDKQVDVTGVSTVSRLQAAFRKFDGWYNDLVCQYNLSLGQILCDVFHTNR
jgi:hypothetical protein